MLERLSFFYIGFPVIIFLLNWIHLWYSIPLIIYLGWYLLKNWENETIKEVETVDNSYYFFGGLLLIFIWIWFSGIGGLSYQNGDYQKHNAILNDLINIDWPVRYEVMPVSYTHLTLPTKRIV